ncbi:hypothetical protein BT96DRAFT_991740 [Gymnopus androsaceus JB14]|uniref:DUF6589 domain-containing protein n=1 Tax=Gymnopus androsaceus JB14 TaxID=1447944 RepID=A0A6A4HY94_9AGAR|nr:hypothetical protein BT96DRAFT_991740 [Gymnopus androsaceus JB14]
MSSGNSSKPYKARPRLKWLTAADASPVISGTYSDSSDYSISSSSLRYQPYSTMRASRSPQDTPAHLPIDENHPKTHHPSLSITIPQIPTYRLSPPPQSALFDPQHLLSSAFVIPPPPIHGRTWKLKRTEDKILQENLDNIADTLRQIGSTFARIIDAIYNHCSAQPSWQSPCVNEQDSAFSLTIHPTSINFAHPSMKAWAAQLCAVQAHQDIKTLTRNDPDHPEYTPAHVSVPHKDGKPVQRVRRPREMCIIASLTPIVNGHNIRVNGYFSMAFGIHLFSAMTEKAQVEMKEIAAKAAENDNVAQALALDNCQQHTSVYEGGGVLPGTWNLKDHLTHVIANERLSMTVESLWKDIDWVHFNDSMELLCIQTLAEEISVLLSHVKTVSKQFRTAPMAIHHIPNDHWMSIQPLGCNSENELSTQGMKRAINDFNSQIGYLEEAAEMLIEVLLETDDLEAYFNDHADNGTLPTFHCLMLTAGILVQQYVSSSAYKRVLSADTQDKVAQINPALVVKTGSPWIAPLCVASKEQIVQGEAEEVACDPDEFDGDCTLANTIVYKLQFGLWLLLDDAIKSGDVRCVMQLLNIWIFWFAGSKHPKYTTYLLELHCLLKYKSSPALQTAILNNYLVKFGFEAQERDLMIEHHVFKLEEMVSRANGKFDGPFYGDIIAPNVNNMTHLNHSLTSAFALGIHKNSHTKPVMSPELKIAMGEFKAVEMHSFCSTQSYNYISQLGLSKGYSKLGPGGKLASFIIDTSRKARFAQVIEDEKNCIAAGDIPMETIHSPSSCIPSSPPPSHPASDMEPTDSTSSDLSDSSDSSDSESFNSDKNPIILAFKNPMSDNSETESKKDDEEMAAAAESDNKDKWSD